MVSNAKLAKVWFLAHCQLPVRDFVKPDKSSWKYVTKWVEQITSSVTK